MRLVSLAPGEWLEATLAEHVDPAMQETGQTWKVLSRRHAASASASAGKGRLAGRAPDWAPAEVVD